MVAWAGARPMWSKPPGLTRSVAVADLPLLVPVTVWVPALVAVQLVPVQLPAGAMLNVVAVVTSPMLLPYWSAAVAVYVALPPARIAVEAGAIVNVPTGPGVTVSGTVAVLPVSVAVTVCTPATVAVQPKAGVEEPSGLMMRKVGPGYVG